MGENERPWCLRPPLYWAYSRQRTSYSLSLPKVTQTKTHFWWWLPLKDSHALQHEPELLWILDIKKKVGDRVQISLETAQGSVRTAEWGKAVRTGWFIPQFCTKTTTMCFWMLLLWESSLSGSVSVCTDKSSRQLWPEVMLKSTRSDKETSI